MPVPAHLTAISLDDSAGRLLRRVTERWLLSVRETNPAILAMFRDRNIRPCRHLLPWSGEFAGKHLTSCAYAYRLTHSRELFDESVSFARELISYQSPDGYLGPFPDGYELSGKCPPPEQQDDPGSGEVWDTWDAWGHYHCMWGLLQWYDLTGDPALLGAVERAAGLFLRTFRDGNRLVDIGSTEMNLAPLHVFANLYVRTKNPEYLRFARELVEDSADERAGNYLRYAEENLPFWECPKPRWESLHIIMGLAEMTKATGERRYLDAACQIFFSILETDVHNTGGFSTREQAVGNPHTFGPIETCCVVAYNALASQLYLATGDQRLVEFLEWSTCNAVAGMFSSSGRWSTYDTPMVGFRRANTDTIVFQSRPGSPELNCCSVNAPRGLAQLADWGYAEDGDTLLLNWLGAANLTTEVGDCVRVEGDAFIEGHFTVEASLAPGRKLRIRIPGWTSAARATIDGQHVRLEGNSLELTHSGRVVFDLTPAFHYEIGTHDVEGLVSVRRGTILFGIDAGDNPYLDINALPPFDPSSLEASSPELSPDGGILLRSAPLVFRDFASLGHSGLKYTSWAGSSLAAARSAPLRFLR